MVSKPYRSSCLCILVLGLQNMPLFLIFFCLEALNPGPHAYEANTISAPWQPFLSILFNVQSQANPHNSNCCPTSWAKVYQHFLYVIPVHFLRPRSRFSMLSLWVLSSCTFLLRVIRTKIIMNYLFACAKQCLIHLKHLAQVFTWTIFHTGMQLSPLTLPGNLWIGHFHYLPFTEKET